MQNGPSVTLYLTLFGIAASFLSTFWAYQYTRLARRLRLYAQRGPQGSEGRLTKASVRKQLWQASPDPFTASALVLACVSGTMWVRSGCSSTDVCAELPKQPE